MIKYDCLHIFNDPKFSVDYFSFLRSNGVSLDQHQLFHYRCDQRNDQQFGSMRKTFSRSFFSLWPNLKLLVRMFESKKIIVHGLASPYLLFYLYLFPFLRNRVFWAMHGKDLYFFRTLKRVRFYHRLYEFFRKKVLREIRVVISDNHEDVKLLRLWYGSNAKVFASFTYPSNFFRPNQQSAPTKAENPFRILVGNSADPANDHQRAFEILAGFPKQAIKLFAPLSYGDPAYRAEVVREGKARFGESFEPMTEFLSREEYNRFLTSIDAGLFTNTRQQGMGNIISLLGMGKKVYINPEVSSWRFFGSLGLTLYSCEEFSLNRCEPEVAAGNREIVKNYYSEANLLKQWQEIFAYQPEVAAREQ